MGVDLRAYLESIISERQRQYDVRFEAQEKAVQAALTAAKEAVTKAEIATEKRFDTTNEWRSAMSDRDRNYLTIAQYEADQATTRTKIEGLETRVNIFAGAVGLVIVAAPIITAIVLRSN